MSGFCRVTNHVHNNACLSDRRIDIIKLPLFYRLIHVARVTLGKLLARTTERAGNV